MKTLKKPKVAKPKILLRPRREEQEDQNIDLRVKECQDREERRENQEDYSVSFSEGSILESSLCAYVSALGERCKSYACRGSNLCAVHSRMVGMTRLDTIREHYASKSKIADESKADRGEQENRSEDFRVKECHKEDRGNHSLALSESKRSVSFNESSHNLALSEDNRGISFSESNRGVGPSLSSKFDVGKHPLLYIKLSKEGKSDIEIASLFQISISTLMRWVHDYEEMKEAYEIGQTMYEAFFLTKGVQNLENDRFNNVLFKYLTMNKLGYSDKVETKSTMQGLHGVVVIPNTLSIQEWEAQSIAKEEKEKQLDLLDQKRRLEPPL